MAPVADGEAANLDHILPVRGGQKAEDPEVAVTIKHAIHEAETAVVVSVPGKATIKDVKQALADKLERPDIMKKARMVRRAGHTFDSFKDSETISTRRQFLLMGVADLKPAPGTFLAEKPLFDLEAAKNLLRELIDGFSTSEFQSAYAEFRKRFPVAGQSFIVERQKLFLTVQSVILPKYGFEGSKKGVFHMAGELDKTSWNEDSEYQGLCIHLNYLLDLDVPSRVLQPRPEGAPPSAPKTSEVPAAVKDTRTEIVVTVRMAVNDSGSEPVEVRVRPRATIKEVKQALALKLGKPDIVKQARMVRKVGNESGVFTGYVNTDRVGRNRVFLVMGLEDLVPAHASSGANAEPEPALERDPVKGFRREDIQTNILDTRRNGQPLGEEDINSDDSLASLADEEVRIAVPALPWHTKVNLKPHVDILASPEDKESSVRAFLRTSRPNWRSSALLSVETRLTRIGVDDAGSLIQLLRRPNFAHRINQRLLSAGERCLKPSILDALRRAAMRQQDGPPELRRDDPLGFGECGIVELPELLEVPVEIPHMIMEFVEGYAVSALSSAMVRITGGRREVFLTGKRSEPFRDFVKQHAWKSLMEGFLRNAQEALEALARERGGELSEDLVALVGASEMQVPHVDVDPGQAQVIVAMTATLPTLVYDQRGRIPSKEETLETMEVPAEHADHVWLAPLLNGGTPLVMPMDELYARMVPACERFEAGDAVLVRDGIVHAGPKSEQDSPEHPRIVLFSTFRCCSTSSRHYNIDFQYKPWDWASFVHVPASVAYRRLQEVHAFSIRSGKAIEPWAHYHEPERADACKRLCTTPGLADEELEILVKVWRGAPSLQKQQGTHRDIVELHAFLLAARSGEWTAKDCVAVGNKLSRVGVGTVSELSAALLASGEHSINKLLQRHGERCFRDRTLDALRHEAVRWADRKAAGP